METQLFYFIFFLIFISCYVSSVSEIFKLYLMRILMCILILTNINWIYKNHPYEYVFFNFGKKALFKV